MDKISIGDVVKVTDHMKPEIEGYPWIPDLAGYVGEIVKIDHWDDGGVVHVKFQESFKVRRPLIGSGFAASEDKLGAWEECNEWCFCYSEVCDTPFEVLEIL